LAAAPWRAHDGRHQLAGEAVVPAAARDRGAECDARVRAWLDEVQRSCSRSSRRSNLYNCLHTLYGEAGVFGTAALWVDEDEETVVARLYLTVGDYWLASSRRLAVDTLLPLDVLDRPPDRRHFAAMRSPPASAPTTDSGLLDLDTRSSTPSSPTRFSRWRARWAWAGRLASQLPFPLGCGSSAASRASAPLLKCPATRSFPGHGAPLGCRRHRYLGSGPGWVALGDSSSPLTARSKRDKLQAIQKMHSRRWSARPSCATSRPACCRAASPTPPTYRQGFPLGDRMCASTSATLGRYRETQERVRRLLRQTVPDDGRKATDARSPRAEIDERHEEKMLILGQWLGGCTTSCLDPLVKRVSAS